MASPRNFEEARQAVEDFLAEAHPGGEDEMRAALAAINDDTFRAVFILCNQFDDK